MSMPINVSGLPSSFTSQPGGATQTTGSPNVSQDQFLKLLVAQLQHQDPLTPQDGSQFIAQLAQISSVQQGAETNQHLTDLAAIQSSTARTAMSGLVGHTVTARTNSFTIGAAGGSPPVQLHLDGPASAVKVNIVDGNGVKVKSLDLGARTQGDIAFNWAAAGVTLPAGTYKVELAATNGAQNTPVSGYAQLSGLVSGVEFASGSTMLRVGAATIAPSDIVTIN